MQHTEPLKRWQSQTHWRNPGKQSRSERTQTAILDATEYLLVERGTDNTSVADIAEQAGCSVGSVYHHFADKTAIFFALFDRTTSEFETFIDATLLSSRWAGMSALQVLDGFITMAQRSHEQRPGYKAAVYLIASDYPQLREHYFELQKRLYQGLLALLLQRKDTIQHPNPDLAASFVLDQIGAMLRVNLDVAQKSSQLVAAKDRLFREEMLRSAASYLRLKESD